MIIDMHTHIFPDRIAEAALANAEVSLGLPARAPGTEGGLRAHMEVSGTDLSIVLAVAPEPRFVRSINDWLLSIGDDRIQFFGTIHPDLEDWDQELKRIRAEGVKGIKFNALVQGIRPDDERMFPIYGRMAEEGMVALFHSGTSYRERDEPWKTLATPERVARVLDAFPGLRVVAAHYGGNHMLEQMKVHLWGRDLYLDTSYPPDVNVLGPDRIVQLIRGHGVERILFGTDYPWETQVSGIHYIRNLDLTEEERGLILGENARRLLFDAC